MDGRGNRASAAVVVLVLVLMLVLVLVDQKAILDDGAPAVCSTKIKP